MALEEKTKILALAHLKTGKKPKDVSQLLNISYAQALKLSKDLTKAEQQNRLQDLFDLEETALNTLLEKVSDELTPAIQTLEGEVEIFDQTLATIGKNVGDIQILEKELTDAAIQLAKKITAQAVATSGTDSLLVLTDALAKLQMAFFAKGTNVQINNMNGNFEKYLKD